MSIHERKPSRTLDQDFIDGAVKLVTQERYKNPSDRVTYLGAIDHCDTRTICSLAEPQRTCHSDSRFRKSPHRFRSSPTENREKNQVFSKENPEKKSLFLVPLLFFLDSCR